jgi:hypothetical protein
VPGPNAYEAFTGEYDPDKQLLRIGLPGDREAFVDFNALTPDSPSVRVVLGDTKLSPTVTLTFANPGKPPKFATVEEAEAWLEEHS